MKAKPKARSDLYISFITAVPFTTFQFVFNFCLDLLFHGVFVSVTSMSKDTATAVWARNIEWELLNGKTHLTLFAQNDQFIMTFFDCTMNVRYVGGTWWSPSNYWWWLLVISTPLPNCGGYAAEIHHFAEVMRWQKHILGRIGCTKMQFELRFNSLQFWIF